MTRGGRRVRRAGVRKDAAKLPHPVTTVGQRPRPETGGYRAGLAVADGRRLRPVRTEPVVLPLSEGIGSEKISWMQPSGIQRALAAAMSTASALGLAVDDAIVLHDSNKLTVRLLPCDVVVGPRQ